MLFILLRLACAAAVSGLRPFAFGGVLIRFAQSVQEPAPPAPGAARHVAAGTASPYGLSPIKKRDRKLNFCLEVGVEAGLHICRLGGMLAVQHRTMPPHRGASGPAKIRRKLWGATGIIGTAPDPRKT
jgi:hypothetical protein